MVRAHPPSAAFFPDKREGKASDACVLPYLSSSGPVREQHQGQGHGPGDQRGPTRGTRENRARTVAGGLYCGSAMTTIWWSGFLPSDRIERRREIVARLRSRGLTSHLAWQNRNCARGSTSARKHGAVRASRPACLLPSGSFPTSAAGRRSTRENCSRKSCCKPRGQVPPEPSSSTLNPACNRARLRPS